MQKTVKPIRTGEEYIESLKGRDLKVYLFGELVKEPVDHPMIRPSINAVAKTYDLAVEEEELEAVQKINKKAEASKTEASSAQTKLDKLYNAITPLLNNLKKNPEKEYILWPNRLEKVEQFEDHIQKIYKN